MAGIKPLVKTGELKTNYLKRQGREKGDVYFKYDSLFDALKILLVSPDNVTVAHYVDDHVALLYLPDTMEIVGIQVEAFEHSFVPENEDRSRKG